MIMSRKTYSFRYYSFVLLKIVIASYREPDFDQNQTAESGLPANLIANNNFYIHPNNGLIYQNILGQIMPVYPYHSDLWPTLVHGMPPYYTTYDQFLYPPSVQTLYGQNHVLQPFNSFTHSTFTAGNLFIGSNTNPLYTNQPLQSIALASQGQVESFTHSTTEVTLPQVNNEDSQMICSLSEQQDSYSQINITNDSESEYISVDNNSDDIDVLNLSPPILSVLEDQNVPCRAESLDVSSNPDQNITEVSSPKEYLEVENTASSFSHCTDKYIAVADNSELLYSLDLNSRLRIKKEKYKRELSMRRFKPTKIESLEKLNSMQRKYEDLLKFLKESDLNDEGNLREIFSPNMANSSTSLLESESSGNIKNVIVLNKFAIESMKSIILNIFSKNGTSNTQNELNFYDLNFSTNDFKALVEKAIFQVEIDSSDDISFIFNTCLSFVNYEEKLFGNKNMTEIVETLKLPKIENLFKKLKECMQINTVYEIMFFMDLYEKNKVEVIQHYVVSTVFLLNALCVYLPKTNYDDFFCDPNYAYYDNSKERISTAAFNVGLLFEKLLRNLKNHEIKADSYGLLNFLRYFFKTNSLNYYRRSMFSIQIPALIAIVLDDLFSFDECQLKEFASFVIYIIKCRKNNEIDFYNDKFEYFIQNNIDSFSTVTECIKSFIKDYGEISDKGPEIQELRKRIKKILEEVPDSDAGMSSKKNTPLRNIYLWQLIWNIALKKKSYAFYTNHSNIFVMVKNTLKKFESYYIES
ncbi:hypothetical protein CWI38_0308p0030 [Hamiltosporidium tvaerminnensis]|uniref:Uncharacterized protein n=1 Tax=Hamiltosporidium tvaerminnensis TaxID=1176355 RepID=A0A4Q9M1E6_9MICR|nr:hypothetical protein CWI38_0308p0030 [Hamiltosporidium tvaerminnensis]